MSTALRYPHGMARRTVRRAGIRLFAAVAITLLIYGGLWGVDKGWAWAWYHCVAGCGTVPDPNPPCDFEAAHVFYMVCPDGQL